LIRQGDARVMSAARLDERGATWHRDPTGPDPPRKSCAARNLSLPAGSSSRARGWVVTRSFRHSDARSSVMRGGVMWHAEIGKFVSIAAYTRINAPNHPTRRASHHHFTYRWIDYGLADTNDAEFFDWRRAHSVRLGDPETVRRPDRRSAAGPGLVGLAARPAPRGAHCSATMPGTSSAASTGGDCPGRLPAPW
jgi:hypothetical protein